jgi:hypothetical protein
MRYAAKPVLTIFTSQLGSLLIGGIQTVISLLLSATTMSLK